MGDLDVFTVYVTPNELNVIFAPLPGIYYTPLEVSMTNQAGGILKYTDDGTSPLDGGASYPGPLRIEETTTIKAAVTDGEIPEEVIYTKTYELKVPVPLLTEVTGGLKVNNRSNAPSGAVVAVYTGRQRTG